jgi:hypothetical protein
MGAACIVRFASSSPLPLHQSSHFSLHRNRYDRFSQPSTTATQGEHERAIGSITAFAFLLDDLAPRSFRVHWPDLFLPEAIHLIIHQIITHHSTPRESNRDNLPWLEPNTTLQGQQQSSPIR